MEFSGRLASFPIGDILQWAHNDRRSGALVVRRSGTEKRIYLHDGDIVACFSDDPAEFFGQHLLVQGLLQESGLIAALTHCQRTSQRLGNAIVELGLLAPEKVTLALRQQIGDQVCDIFLWRSGIFYFAAESLPETQHLAEPLSSVGLAMEGTRWLDEYQRIRQVFVHDNIVLQRGRKQPQGLLTPLERRVYRAVDGKLSLAELYNEVRGSHFRFLQAAYRLAVVEVFDIAAVGEHGESPSTELRLADLLIEQVTEEQAVVLRQSPAVPLDAIEGSYPLWDRTLALEEEARLSPAMRDFCRSLDGSRTLRAALDGASPEERARRVDWLVLQLRRNALALLAAPAGPAGAPSPAPPRA